MTDWDIAHDAILELAKLFAESEQEMWLKDEVAETLRDCAAMTIAEPSDAAASGAH